MVRKDPPMTLFENIPFQADATRNGGSNFAAPAPAGTQPYPPLPDDAMLIVPVRNIVLFPGIVIPLSVGRERSLAAVQEAVRLQRPIGLLLQKNSEAEEPTVEDLHDVGTTASIVRYMTGNDGTHHAIVKGQQRFKVNQFLEGYPFMVARVQQVEEPDRTDPEVEGRARALRQRAIEIIQLLPQVPEEVGNALQGHDRPAQLADFIAGLMDATPEEKQSLLATFDLTRRLDKLLDLLAHRLEVLKVSRDIEEKTRESIGDSNRKHLLREQMRNIQKELGEEDEEAAEVDELAKAIDDAKMPEDVDKQARKELKRLQRMQGGGMESSMIRTYLEWLVELPWKEEPQAAIDLVEARKVLDEDHYGLDKIKRRILEYLAVRKLNPSGKSPILCFVGPPGVGKTSLGQSIAKATARKFQRVSLGGVHDEAEIRGHRRTYVGSLPGNIIQAMKKAESRNTVLMLDEVDKLGGGGYHGDPSSALLEVLDPEQNSTFRDNYLGVPYDLSRVMFIATANQLDTIPGPLRDRMEVIQLPGYTAQEKLQIARRYLVARQLASAGLTAEQFEVTDEALMALIADYTREAGVRNLEREIGNLIRHAAVRIAEGQVPQVKIGADDIASILGPLKYEAEIAMRASVPGVATGLAWTPVGGDILFIEAARMPGSGKLILTGQLGDVMKESAQAALSLVKARSAALGIDPAVFEKSDIHVHVPAGATPKDGPSAGVAMFTALSSLLTGRAVRSDVAMTGEISLRGLVMPIGGVKEKVLAALRAGIKTVMLPTRNKRDLEDIPADARAQLQFVWVESVDEAMATALSPLSTAVAA
ncbi:endopeptidase La [Betaproteobacteria bacterium GR16-43]|nr:endopeptidase La [Betaproteobacteria bacterium GR16-43]